MHQRPLLQITRNQEDVQNYRYFDKSRGHHFHLPALPDNSGFYEAQLPKLDQPYTCADRDLLIYVKWDQEAKLLLEHSDVLPSIRSSVNLGLPVHLPVRHQQ